MGEERIHRATSDDGTEIAGRVHGQGPPLVLVHGGLEDGDLDWVAMLPFLRKQFTCYLMSTRGRGLSGEAADQSPQRRVEDVAAFVDSIGEPVYLFGESDGGALALGAAARTGAVSALAVHEPAVFEVLDKHDGARFEETVGRAGDAAAAGDQVEAARIFASLIAGDDELAALSTSNYFAEAARYMPVLLAELEQQSGAGFSPTDPAVLATITAPVLLLHGSQSALRDFFTAGVRHVGEHVPDTRVCELPDSGHWGVTLAPGPIASELVQFFKPAPEPA